MYMRRATVYCLQIPAGILSRDANGYTFQYLATYLENADLPAISLTLPRQAAPFRSQVLFAFFFGLLAEGELKTVQCRVLRIDEHDHFTRLLKTCSVETIGGVTIQELP